jgi:hypothetical protein
VDKRFACLPRLVGGVEDALQLRFHVEQLAAGVLCLRTADRHQNAQRAGNGDGGRGAADVDPPVQLDAGMEHERARLRQPQRFPRQIGERIGDGESKLQGTVQSFRLGDNRRQRRRYLGRQKGVRQLAAQVLQYGLQLVLSRLRIAGIAAWPPVGSRTLQLPLKLVEIEVGPRRRAGDLDTVTGQRSTLRIDRQPAGQGAYGLEATGRWDDFAGARRRASPLAL